MPSPSWETSLKSRFFAKIRHKKPPVFDIPENGRHGLPAADLLLIGFGYVQNENSPRSGVQNQKANKRYFGKIVPYKQLHNHLQIRAFYEVFRKGL